MALTVPLNGPPHGARQSEYGCTEARGWRSSRTVTAATSSSRTVTYGHTSNHSRDSSPSPSSRAYPTTTLSPAQLAEELGRYASASAATGLRPSAGLQDPFLVSCLRELSPPHHLQRLRPSQLATVLRSLVLLGAQPGEDWLADVDFACYCHPGPFSPASTASVMQSLADLHADAAAAEPPKAQPASGVVGEIGTASRQHCHHHQSRSRRPMPASRGFGRTTSYFASIAAPAPSTLLSSSLPAATFRFPHAVYLRLLQPGGVSRYSYEQLVVLLQSFRGLGIAVEDEAARAVGGHMAAQLRDMAPEQRAAALAGVLGGGAGSAAAVAGEELSKSYENAA